MIKSLKAKIRAIKIQISNDLFLNPGNLKLITASFDEKRSTEQLIFRVAKPNGTTAMVAVDLSVGDPA